jgi:hypothetical protein
MFGLQVVKQHMINLLFCSNLCKLVFKRFVDITILGVSLLAYAQFAYELGLWSIGAFDGE